MSGPFATNLGGTISRDESPCGFVLTRDEPTLMSRVHELFPALANANPPVHEALLTPFRVDGRTAGTIWAIKHSTDDHFDTEDARVLCNLARFASAAHKMAQALEDAKRAQQGIEKRFTMVVQNLRDHAIMMVDPNGFITEWSDGAKQVLGYSADEVIGKHISVLFTGQDIAAGEPQRELAEATISGRAEREAWRLHRNGRSIWVNVVLSAVHDESGRLLGFAKISRDLTEKKRAELEREALESRLSTELNAMTRLHEMSMRLMRTTDMSEVLNEVLDATIALQRADRGNVQLYDPKQETLTLVAQRGFSSEFLEHFAYVTADEELACSRAARLRERVVIEDVAQDPLFSPYVDVALRADYRAVQSTPIIDREGNVLGILSTHFRVPRKLDSRELRLTDLYVRLAADVILRMRNEQDLRLAQQTAERASRGKSRFLATASHDLRQPLQTLALLHGALRRAATDPKLQTIVTEQQQAIAAMSSLLGALLDISKLESGAVKPQVVDFDLATVRDAMRAEFAPLAEKKGLLLETHRCMGSARSDPTLIAQILRNLIGNAIRYTSAGSVELRCTSLGDTLRIEVADTGIGIPEELLANIFDEFYQVGITPNSTREGHGLGLNIVQRTARVLGHDVEVQSEVGVGSTFSITVPAGQSVASQVEAGTKEDRTASEESAHVLVVDDEPGVLKATQILLQIEGYRVSTAMSRAEAVTVARARQDIRVLVTDYHLANDELGTSVIESVREVLGEHLGCILISGDTSSAMRRLVRDERTRIASKPVDADELLGLLKSLAQSSR